MTGLDDIRDWLAEHMPGLHRETIGKSDKDCHAHLCDYLGIESERGDERIILRKLKQAHFGG